MGARGALWNTGYVSMDPLTRAHGEQAYFGRIGGMSAGPERPSRVVLGSVEPLAQEFALGSKFVAPVHG